MEQFSDLRIPSSKEFYSNGFVLNFPSLKSKSLYVSMIWEDLGAGENGFDCINGSTSDPALTILSNSFNFSGSRIN